MIYNKRLPYIIFVVISGLWITFFPYFREEFLNQFYYMPFLGIIAATVANTTPAAAGIVYFPILTKLNINPDTAVHFSLIIQAYGMGLGTFKWYLVNKKLFLKDVLPVCLFGGIIGVTVSILFLPIKDPGILTTIFNFIAFLFTQIIFISILFKRKYPNIKVDLNALNVTILSVFSLIGGLVSGWIGFGIDTMFYFILTIIFRVNPAISIVTSISLMAAVSLTGTILNVAVNDVPFSLWYSAVPGVTAAGLFLAAYLAIKIGPKNVLLLFTFFLSTDFLLSLWTQETVPMTETVRTLVIYALVTYLLVIHVKIFKESYKEINPELGEFRSD